jgi:hypothetical protein
VRYLILILLALLVAAGCSSQVAKDTAKETTKDAVKDINQGFDNAVQNVEDAAPLIKDDLKEGFWNALDSIGDTLDVDTGKEPPKPGDEKIQQLHAQVDAAEAKGVVESAKKVREQKITDIATGLGILAQTIEEEINKQPISGATTVNKNGTVTSNTPTGTTSSPAPGTSASAPSKLPTKEEIQTAWVDLSKLTDKPAAVKRIFETVANFVNSHQEYEAKAGIAGPVSMDKIGPKAQAFLAKLQPGDISKPFKFKDGHVIIQLIDNAADKVEVGYIYIPNKETAATTTPSTGTAPSTTSTPSSGAAPSGGK